MLREEILISVVIPAYNAAHCIRTALDSVLNQTYRNYEILVLNDGSPDTELLEKTLIPYSQHIRYFRLSHAGPSAARNAGIKEASGTYIAFLDSDDFWLPDHLETNVALLLDNPSLGLVYGDSLIVRGDQVIGKTFDRESQVSPVTFDALMQEDCTVSTSTTVASKAALLAVGLFDEHFDRCEDFDLWLRMAYQGTVMTHHSNATVCRTLSSNGLSASGYKMKIARLAVLAKTLSLPNLSGFQKDRLVARYRLTEAMAHLDRFKVCIQCGEFDEAVQAGKVASTILPGRKLRAAVACLEHAPQTVQFYYRLHERALAIRNRKRAAKSSRTWAVPFPPSVLSSLEPTALATVAMQTASAGD